MEKNVRIPGISFFHKNSPQMYALMHVIAIQYLYLLDLSQNRPWPRRRMMPKTSVEDECQGRVPRTSAKDECGGMCSEAHSVVCLTSVHPDSILVNECAHPTYRAACRPHTAPPLVPEYSNPLLDIRVQLIQLIQLMGFIENRRVCHRGYVSV